MYYTRLFFMEMSVACLIFVAATAIVLAGLKVLSFIVELLVSLSVLLQNILNV